MIQSTLLTICNIRLNANQYTTDHKYLYQQITNIIKINNVNRSNHLRYMHPDLTCRKFHELVPVPCLLLATGPVLLGVMEHRLSIMVSTTISHVIFFIIGFQTPFIDTFIQPFFSQKYFFFFLFFHFFLFPLLLFFLSFIIIHILYFNLLSLQLLCFTVQPFLSILHCIRLEKLLLISSFLKIVS